MECVVEAGALGDALREAKYEYEICSEMNER